MKNQRIKIKINDHIIEGIGTLNNDVLSLKTKEETINDRTG